MTSPLLEAADAPVVGGAQPARGLLSLDGTALHLPTRGVVVGDGAAKVYDAPLFGLHNRDYPSIWAAHEIAKLTSHELVEFDGAVQTIIERARQFAASLRDFDTNTGFKLTALFPASSQKREAADSAFLYFAIGSYAKRGHGLNVSGPLFAWRLCQLKGDRKRKLLGLTEAGYTLLESLDGISLALPHSQQHARAFLSHLQQYARKDWVWFRRLLRIVAEESMRDELITAFRDLSPGWTSEVASTYAAGYVARAREWGLVEPKQRNGMYFLTAFGREYLEQVGDDPE